MKRKHCKLKKQNKKNKLLIDCCICLQNLDTDKHFLRCAHSFHNECIKEWLKRSNKCPICRLNIYEDQNVIFEREIIEIFDNE